MAITLDNLCQPATPVKNWRILLEQSFTVLADGNYLISVQYRYECLFSLNTTGL